MLEVFNQYDLRTNRERIFIEMINELNWYVKNGNKNPYSLTRKAAILRLLLIDNGGLFVSIAKPYRMKLKVKLKFTTAEAHSLSNRENPRSKYMLFKYLISEDGDEITLKTFLTSTALWIDDPYIKEHIDGKHVLEKYCIRNIIKLVANAHGGVHMERWENIPSFILTNSHSPFNINSNSKLHDIIDYTSEITLHALLLLRTNVTENLRNTKPISIESARKDIKVDKPKSA